jgi:small subunit ribosomal protein S2
MAMDEKTPVVPAAEAAPEAPAAGSEAAQAAEPITLTESVGLRDLLDAGLHFGHQTKRWNPKMRPFIFDKRNGIHVIDLTQSLSQLQKAQEFLAGIVASGRGVLFVGTKKQAQTTVREVSKMCGQYSVTSRWLGGTLTNNRTVRNSIKRMRALEKMEKEGEFEKLPKKEVAVLRHELAKLQKNLSGIADMEQLPGAMVIVDINREANAVKEAQTLHIPVVAIVDTCCNPDPISFPIPATMTPSAPSASSSPPWAPPSCAPSASGRSGPPKSAASAKPTACRRFRLPAPPARPRNAPGVTAGPATAPPAACAAAPAAPARRRRNRLRLPRLPRLPRATPRRPDQPHAFIIPEGELSWPTLQPRWSVN